MLRCFVTEHKAGNVSLQVACEGYVISNTCHFSFREDIGTPGKEEAKKKDWFDIPGTGGSIQQNTGIGTHVPDRLNLDPAWTRLGSGHLTTCTIAT